MPTAKSTTPKKTDSKFKLPDSIRKKLREPFPDEAYKALDKSKNQDGKFLLTSLKVAYVVERLNDVFGACGWNLDYTIIHESDNEIIVHGNLYFPQYELSTPMQFGGGQKRGKLVEDAYKSCVSSLISKCASYVGIGHEMYKGLIAPPKRKNNTVNTPQKSQPKPKPNGLEWHTVEDKSFTAAMLDARKWNGKYHKNKNGQEYIIINDINQKPRIAVPISEKKKIVAEEFLAFQRMTSDLPM